MVQKLWSEEKANNLAAGLSELVYRSNLIG
ncbi:hypothetical protein B0H99_107189 [Planomicrobium soli]|uniref:Uncharacterized protein n=1 Tax=Planomicrobium soli TaxID=1176648 RepID=A0A2P8GQX4_9BACL|nr:hypothetical protein B0H99_107189 [Planomicrobium soli]